MTYLWLIWANHTDFIMIIVAEETENKTRDQMVMGEKDCRWDSGERKMLIPRVKVAQADGSSESHSNDLFSHWERNDIHGIFHRRFSVRS